MYLLSFFAGFGYELRVDLGTLVLENFSLFYVPEKFASVAAPQPCIFFQNGEFFTVQELIRNLNTPIGSHIMCS
jgi:hypothetical protein